MGKCRLFVPIKGNSAGKELAPLPFLGGSASQLWNLMLPYKRARVFPSELKHMKFAQSLPHCNCSTRWICRPQAPCQLFGLEAVPLALHHWAPVLQGLQVMIAADNTTVVYKQEHIVLHPTSFSCGPIPVVTLL